MNKNGRSRAILRYNRVSLYLKSKNEAKPIHIHAMSETLLVTEGIES